MKNEELSRLGEELLHVAASAASAINEVYAAPFAVDYKSPGDPVTLADRRSNEIICAELLRLLPGVPCVAEESDSAEYSGWRESDAVWFVDPLDGTRDFVARNGDFVVMIGLAQAGRARLGVIHAPATGRRFLGIPGAGSFEVLADGTRKPLAVSTHVALSTCRLVVSRSHPSPVLDQAFASRVGRADRVGSAGLKALAVATAEADLYAHLGAAGWRWDACAPEAIATAAGATVTDAMGQPIDYRAASLRNDHGILVSNGHVHDEALEVLRTAAAAAGGGSAG